MHLTRIEQSYYSVQMAIDHVILPVRDYESSKAFYAGTLRQLGFELMLDWPDARRALFGIGGEPSSLWLVESQSAGTLELCLGAEQPEAVDAFHAEALGTGGRSSGSPEFGLSSTVITTRPASRIRTGTRSRSCVAARSERARSTVRSPRKSSHNRRSCRRDQ